MPIARDGTNFVLMIVLKININQKIAVIQLCVDYVWARHVTAREQRRVEGSVCERGSGVNGVAMSKPPYSSFTH